MAVAKYISFAAFIIYAGTGIAVAYVGFSLLAAYVAYLSPWIPAWLWIVMASIIVLGISITATSTLGAIATLSPKPHAFKLCISLLVVMVVSEVATTGLVYRNQHILGRSLSGYMKQQMVESQKDYGKNISDTQLWDEIQLEMNCCGTKSYKDWFVTNYGNDSNVPDSCCLIVELGCGQDIASTPNPGDDIIMKGCLPTILEAIGLDYHTMSRDVWLPVCALHVMLLILLFATSMFLQEGVGGRLHVYSVSAILPQNTKYMSLHNSE